MAVSARMEQKKRTAALETLRAGLDPFVGRRTRMIAALLMSLIWILAPAWVERRVQSPSACGGGERLRDAAYDSGGRTPARVVDLESRRHAYLLLGNGRRGVLHARGTSHGVVGFGRRTSGRSLPDRGRGGTASRCTLVSAASFSCSAR